MDREELQARYAEDSRRLAEAASQLEGSTFAGSSDDGHTTVTVDANGRFDGVQFDPRAFRSPMVVERIEEGVKLAFERAYQAMADRRNELYRPIIGPDYDAGVSVDGDQPDALEAAMQRELDRNGKRSAR